MKLSRLLILTVLFFTGCACSAKAEIFRWQDPESGLTLNFPDRWGRIHNQQPDDLITIAAPRHEDQASCRMRAREDRRFLVYTPEYATSIQKRYFGHDFWARYLGEYDDPRLIKIQDESGLGRGFASYAEVSYMPTTGIKERKRAMVFATNYGGMTYIFECSALQSVYGRWYPGFTNILRSINFKKHSDEMITGDYRNFLEDDLLRVHGRTPQNIFIY